MSRFRPKVPSPGFRLPPSGIGSGGPVSGIGGSPPKIIHFRCNGLPEAILNSGLPETVPKTAQHTGQTLEPCGCLPGAAGFLPDAGHHRPCTALFP